MVEEEQTNRSSLAGGQPMLLRFQNFLWHQQFSGVCTLRASSSQLLLVHLFIRSSECWF